MRYFSLLLIAIFSFEVSAMAQASRVSASLHGVITDASGARIPGVSVRVLNTSTNVSRTVLSDDHGFFRLVELPVGSYEVRVTHTGFAPYLHSNLLLEVGSDTDLDIVLQTASAKATVTVTAQPSALDTSHASVTSTVDRERIEELPVESRNALQFVLIEPGILASHAGAAGSPHAALADSGFSTGGLRPRSNSISIDGLDNNDEFTGSSRTELSPEIVQEYQVVRNGISAEFGGASGGSINVLTRSGSNTIHGDAFIFLQDAATNARDPFETEPEKPQFHRFRTGFAIGGPIVKNKTFYYAAAEQEHNRGQNGSDLNPATVLALNNFLSTGAFSRLPTRQLSTDFSPISRAETEATGKLDHQLNPNNSLMLRYSFTNNRVAGDAFNVGGLEDPSERGSSFIADNAIAAAWTSTFGSNAANDLRFEAATRHAVVRTSQTAGPEIVIDGLAAFGQPYSGNIQRRENHGQLTDGFTRSSGRHIWKAGATVNRVTEGDTVLDGFGGVYLFADLPSFFAAQPDFFLQSFGNPSTNFAVTSYGGFFQDHWSAFRHATVDLGVRYDFEQLPSAFNQDTNNFSPRIGFAYNFSRRWVARAGYGVFFDRQILANLNRAIDKNGINAFENVADGAEAAAVFQSAMGGTVMAPVPGIAPSIFRPDSLLATPYSEQTSAGLQYLLATNLTLSADYLFVRGVKLSRTRNVNLLPPVILTTQNASALGIPSPAQQQIGREVFGPSRANPLFNDVYQIEDSSASSYNGLTLSLNRRMNDELEFLASYTFSKDIDDASDYYEQPQNPFDLRDERALSLQDQRHNLVFDALWDLPIGPDEDAPPSERHNLSWPVRIFDHIEVAPIFTLGSPRPVDPLVGLDSSRSNAFPLADRPLGIARNSLQTSALDELDFRVLKYFPFGEYAHLDLVAEAFNLLNHTNVTEINPYFGSEATPPAEYGEPIGGLSARRIEFSVDFEY